MASLHRMLSEEGFEHREFLRSRDRLVRPDESVILPIDIFHDQKRLQFPNQKTDMGSTRKGSSVFSSRRVSSDTERSQQSKSLLQGEEPAIDVIAIRAVVSILSGYIGRYIKDVVEEKATGKGVKMESLKNSIQLLSNVASLNSKKSRKGSTCGVPNSHLSACAQLFLSIAYKLEKNDRIFGSISFFPIYFILRFGTMRSWRLSRISTISRRRYGMKALSKAYNDQMDMGTIQFALYYKEWIKILYNSRSSTINTNLYRAVFGPTKEFDSLNRASMDTWNREEDNVCIDEYKDFQLCYSAIRVTAKAWLDSNGSNVIEGALSKAPVIAGLLEVLLASTDDEVQELAISILAELVLKPKAKQMISIDWVALVLRVLEFGGQLQTLFTVRCLPEKAAMYFLGQLLTGFDEDKNLENASQVVALGGLSFLIRIFEKGDITERNHAATLMSCCIRANWSSRNYIAENLNKDSLLQLIVLGIQKKFKGCVFTLLADLLCLSRRTRISKFLTGLSNGWGGLNTMHIFLVYLQRASPEERPLVATVLLQLDLM
ncbi:hypothetical protein OIU76_000116 [Salix suchowensis]|nr:hypothetical protein OIU76_000116 [Salix suchowensis]